MALKAHITTLVAVITSLAGISARLQRPGFFLHSNVKNFD